LSTAITQLFGVGGKKSDDVWLILMKTEHRTSMGRPVFIWIVPVSSANGVTVVLEFLEDSVTKLFLAPEKEMNKRLRLPTVSLRLPQVELPRIR
jgi:hypothetical protein